MNLSPNTIWLIITCIWAVVICCNFYVGYVQIQLFHKGLLDNRWRIGSNMLKAALEAATDRRDIRMIRKAALMSKISVGAFMTFLLSIAWMAI
jgi:hypothetical protein